MSVTVDRELLVDRFA